MQLDDALQVNVSVPWLESCVACIEQLLEPLERSSVLAASLCLSHTADIDGKRPSHIVVNNTGVALRLALVDSAHPQPCHAEAGCVEPWLVCDHGAALHPLVLSVDIEGYEPLSHVSLPPVGPVVLSLYPHQSQLKLEHSSEDIGSVKLSLQTSPVMRRHSSNQLDTPGTPLPR